MTPPVPPRSAPVAFGRGVAALAANPGLALAPIAFGIASALTAGAFALAVGAGAAGFFGAREMAYRGGPKGLPAFLEDLRGVVLASPVVLLVGLLVLAVVLLLLTALAAWLRAGLTGALAEADARAGSSGARDAFRLPEPGRAFVASANRLFGRFFALVNLYGFAATFLVALLLAPLAVALAAGIGRRTLLAAAAVVAFLAALAVAIAGIVFLRVAYLAAARSLAVDRVDTLTAVGNGLALLKGALGRALALYLLTVAGVMAIAVAFAAPRVALTLALGAMRAGIAPIVGVSAIFIVLQMVAALAFDAAVTGAFVALWPQELPGEAPGAPLASATSTEAPAP